MKLIAIYLVRFYQFFISPWLGKNCRFYPTCSDYAKEALELHGFFLGAWLTIKRILKCQPFCEGGCDEVPNPYKMTK